MENNKDSSNNNLYTVNIIQKFLKLCEPSENEELNINIVKPIFFKYCKKFIGSYLNIPNEKVEEINKKRRRNLNYLLKKFINGKINKYSLSKKSSDLIFINLIIFCFQIFREVCKYKNAEKNLEIRDLFLAKLDILLSNILIIISKLYFDKIIDDNRWEICLKFLIILSISLKPNEEPNKNDNILNMMFFKECINKIIFIFNKIYESQKQFTERQEKLVNNILLFIKENVINYSNQKPINILNKSYLSHNDYYTSNLINLIFIISKMKNWEIIKNFVELLTNIYAFSFRYDNIMNPIIKILEPLFINLNLKTIEEINNELFISNFPLKLLNGLIDKEVNIKKEDPTFLKSGFYLGNKICGLSSEIDNLGEDFLIIFGFSLHEINIQKNNIKEWTLINIRNNKEKDKESQIKIWLSLDENLKDQYNLLVSIKNKDYPTNIIITSKKTYIFSFNFIKGYTKRKLKIYYTCESDAFPIKEVDEINIQNFSTENTNIYIGCDINNPINLIKESNTFTGFIGTVIIINQKKLNKKNQEEISKLFLKLKGDYASIINMSFQNNDYKSCLIDNEQKYISENEYVYRQIRNRIIELNERPSDLNFVESIKILISPNSFRLIEYRDEIDYLNLKTDFELYEEYKRENKLVRENYLEFKQKTGVSKSEKMIKIFTSFFNNRFHSFENKNTLEEFIKYDGIHYLCLLLEYYCQILCNLNDLIDAFDNKKENVINEIKDSIKIKDIYEKIENNIFELNDFFNNKIILNQKYCEIFYKEINHYLYQLSITMKKFMVKNNINKKFFDSISSIIDIFNNYISDDYINGSKYVTEIKKIRNKLLDFLHKLSLCFNNDDNFIEKIDYYLDIITKLLTTEYLNELFSKDFMNKLLSLSFIFDHSKSFFKKKSTSKILQKKYSNLLIEFLKISYNDFLVKSKKEIKNENLRKSSIFSILKKNKNNEEKKEEKKENNFEFLNYYMEYTLQSINNEYIFAGLLSILDQSELIEKTPSNYMEQIQDILEQNYRKINENKKCQLISEASLRILSSFYLTDREKEKKLHEFLRNLEFYKGFFYSIISSLKYIKYITNDNKFVRNFQSDKNLRKVSGSEDNDSTISLPEINDKNKISNNLDLFPLLDLDLESLNKRQNQLLIALLQDCISMIFIENSYKIYEYITENEAQEIYDTLIKNFEKVLLLPGKFLYNEIFSSDKEITPELFFFKWKLSNKEMKKKLIEDVEKYNKELLIYHSFPFIFKFILLINLDEEYEEDMQDMTQDMTRDTLDEEGKYSYILDLLSFIYNELESYFLKEYEINNKNENTYNFICNLINFLILINKIFIKKESQILFKNSSFHEMFFKLVELLENTGLLYSNYCFEIEDNSGKIISEICFDLFIYLLDYSFNDETKKNFTDKFIIHNKKYKEYYSIFYLIDLNKEEILEKEKNIKKELSNYIKEYPRLMYIHKNIFNNKDQKKRTKIFGKKINHIEEVNFTIYFLSKTFLYLSSGISKTLSDLLSNYFLPILAENIFRLWTKNNPFYGHKICKRFALYSETKSFFEAHVIQDPTNLNNYKEFFQKDIPSKLKNNYKLKLCFASRLLDKKDYDFENNNITKEGESCSLIKKTKTFKSNNNNSNINIFTNIIDCNNCFFDFEKLEKKYMIYNPKNYLMKIIFSSTFKDIFFKDIIFQKIRSTYLCTFRKHKTLFTKTKQLNYPIRLKNFSNSLEPKTFFRRDYNFYREEFFNISHNYLKKNIFKDKDIQKLYFYPHDYFSNTIFNNKEKSFYCELVTNQYLYFGRMNINKKSLCFITEKDPRDDNNINIDKFYQFVYSTKDNDNKTTKQKSFVVFIKDIKEVIKRRTLLMNQSIEIFNKNGKSYFFNLFKTDSCDKLFNIFSSINQNLILENKEPINLISRDIKADTKKIISSFKKGEITNYEYILQLNKLSTRTYNDLTQYPVFPWLILKINKLNELTDKFGPVLDNNIINKEEKEDPSTYLRDLNYPVSMQNESKREEEINKYIEDLKTSKYTYHCGTHYSTSSYIFYYLMRINPFGQNLIKLQNYKQENPNRMFLSFRETQLILESSTDNRELIPDIYCYIDYLCNINCSFFGKRTNSNLVDDFYVNNAFIKYDQYTNIISSFVESLYRHKKYLNSETVSKNIDKWVDIIFGKKQFPPKEEAIYSCNIFNKLTYEQNNNLTSKLEKYKNLLEKGIITEKKLISKIQNKINIIINFGICPCQILNETIVYEGNNILQNQQKQQNKNMPKFTGNYYFFTKINKNQYLAINDHLIKGNLTTRNVNIYEDNISKDPIIYQCGNFENDISHLNINNDIPLYKPNYAISEITLMSESNQKKEIFILTCRFLGNYFKIQNFDRTKMILCEDFVTTINKRNSNENDNVFYTGLKNGKLIEWKIKINEIINLNNKKKNQSYLDFTIKEKKHVYAHKSSITAIEINNSKNIIATAGEDKFIYIRKLYDFEILTSIDLVYSFENPIISKSPNVFPSLIKISDLNCIYVLLYNYSLHKTLIRGYTLNGLFFAQTDDTVRDNNNFSYNNISFNKNGNLIVGLYNNNEIILLNSYNLKGRFLKRLVDKNEKMVHNGSKWLEYDSSSKEFCITYDNECKILTVCDEEQRMFDS